MVINSCVCQFCIFVSEGAIVFRILLEYILIDQLIWGVIQKRNLLISDCLRCLQRISTRLALLQTHNLREWTDWNAKFAKSKKLLIIYVERALWLTLMISSICFSRQPTLPKWEERLTLQKVDIENCVIFPLHYKYESFFCSIRYLVI